LPDVRRFAVDFELFGYLAAPRDRAVLLGACSTTPYDVRANREPFPAPDLRALSAVERMYEVRGASIRLVEAR
jgi:hypothetical protein